MDFPILREFFGKKFPYAIVTILVVAVIVWSMDSTKRNHDAFNKDCSEKGGEVIPANVGDYCIKSGSLIGHTNG